MTSLSGRAASAPWTTCHSAERPQMGCRTFGRAERSRLPSPAARITAASDRLRVVVVLATMGPCEGGHMVADGDAGGNPRRRAGPARPPSDATAWRSGPDDRQPE